MDMLKMGAYLKKLRNEKGLTQEELSEKFGVTRRSVSRWETGDNLPDIDILIEMSDFYNVELKDLLQGGNKNMENKEKETAILVDDYNKTNNNNTGYTITLEGDKLISISNSVEKLIIPSRVANVTSSVLTRKYPKLRSVTVQSQEFDINTFLENNPDISELIIDTNVTFKKQILSSLKNLVRLELNGTSTLNDISPFQNMTSLKWLSISNLTKDTISTLFGGNSASLHYLEIRDSSISTDFFKNISVNGVSFVGCNIASEALVDAKIENIYLGVSNIFANKEEIKKMNALKRVLYQGTATSIEAGSKEIFENKNIKTF